MSPLVISVGRGLHISLLLFTMHFTLYSFYSHSKRFRGVYFCTLIKQLSGLPKKLTDKVTVLTKLLF